MLITDETIPPLAPVLWSRARMPEKPMPILRNLDLKNHEKPGSGLCDVNE